MQSAPAVNRTRHVRYVTRARYRQAFSKVDETIYELLAARVTYRAVTSIHQVD